MKRVRGIIRSAIDLSTLSSKEYEVNILSRGDWSGVDFSTQNEIELILPEVPLSKEKRINSLIDCIVYDRTHFTSYSKMREELKEGILNIIKE